MKECPMIGYNFGIRIVPTSYWGKVPDGSETVRFKADPIICWLSRFLPINPYVEAEYPKYRDADPIMDGVNNVIYCSHAQAKTISEQFKKANM